MNLSPNGKVALAYAKAGFGIPVLRQADLEFDT